MPQKIFFSAAQVHFFGALFLQNVQASAGVSLFLKSPKKTETQVPIWVEPGSDSQANR
jgi:hypothetical protein